MQSSVEYGVGLDYWFRWQVPVCALIIIIPTAVAISFVGKQKETQSLLYSAQLWMPCWTNLSPLWLLLYRAFAFISMSFLLYQTVVTLSPFVFFFYTQWTFSLVIFYFALATIISANGYWKYLKSRSVPNRDGSLKKDSDSSLTFKEKESTHSQLQFDQHAGFWENLMQNVYQTCAGAVMLTDIVFWCLLLPFQAGDTFTLTLLIGCMHSVNAVFLLLDSALNSLPFPWHGLTYFVLWSSSYVVFQWGLHVYGFTWWPYPFFELGTPWAPIWYLALALVHLPCYGIYVLLVRLKSTLFPRIFPRAFLRDVTGKKKHT